MSIKLNFFPLIYFSLGCVFFSLLVFHQIGCTGSGAVNPITPKNSSSPDSASSADSDVIYWTSYPVTFTLSDPLNGVFLVSKKLGWACGNNGLVLKYDGDTWSKVDTGLAMTQNLMAVAFANENEGWIVGSRGTILHYNNGTWNLDDSPTQEILSSIAITRSKTVWVVGSNGTILTYNGISWGKIVAAAPATAGSPPVTVTEYLTSVALSDQNNGWAVGGRGTILRYDGQTWQPMTSPSTENLNSVSAVNNVQAWIVGAFGTILNFNGTTWNKQGSASSGFDLYQVFMRNENDGWAIGQEGTILYYDGSRWISHVKPLTKPSLNALSFYKDLGFAVGSNGTILKFQPNGEPTKLSFLFKGEVAKKPSKAIPFWNITYTLMNQGPKTSPFITYELPIPKGFQPYQKKDTPTPTPSSGVSLSAPLAALSLTPTPTPTLAAAPGKASTPSGVQGTVRVPTAMTGGWKMRDNNLEWEIGSVSSSELKTLTILLEDKKGEKKEYPVLLKAILKANDKVVAEAAPVTVLASEKAAAPQPEETPPVKKGATLKNAPTPLSTVPANPLPSPTVSGPVAQPVPAAVTPAGMPNNPQGGGSTSVKPTPAGGN